MTDNAQEPMQLAIQRVYVKDISFESPKSPAIFMKTWEPSFKVSLGVQHSVVEADLYEVILKVSVSSQDADDQVVFMIDVQQAGLFSIKNLDKTQKSHALNAFCPSILFPYARETIDALATRGSFPALILDPVNFEAMYSQSLEREAQGSTATN